MFYWLFQWFVRITGFIPAFFAFRKKTYYVDKKSQGRKIKGGAIIISNHTSVYDVALHLFVFCSGVIRPLIAEVMYRKNIFLTLFLKQLGGIKVNREDYDFSFMAKTIDIINKGQKALIFPESRLPREGETELLEFKPSFVYIALQTNAPIIPVYTNGSYMNKKRARLIIGEKIYLHDLYDESKSEQENISYLTNYVREYILTLGKKLDEKGQKEKK
ncbi:MAG: lysophospholipid acyltransferase family protein [Acholeplasmataceae bacterium]